MTTKRTARKKSETRRAIDKVLVALSPTLSEMERSTRLGREIRQARETFLDKSFETTRRGDVIAKGLSTLIEKAVQGLYRAGAEVFPEEAHHLAVLAVGGFGRGRLAPHSDIDLLFLHTPNNAQKTKPLLDFILYALWDAGLTVAQSVHSPAGAITFVKSDIEGCTSYLDSRMLEGDAELARDFFRRYERYRQQTVPDFVEAKLKEREARIARGVASRYAVEPDIKEGKGGLRDLETLHWLSRYAYGAENVAERVEKGVFSDEEATSFEKALDFLWSVRVQLHRLRGRADEILSFDIQPAVAEALNYKDRGQTLGVERLMKHYFINAKEVGRLTGVVCAELEEAEVKRSRLIESFFQAIGNNRGQRKLNRHIRHDELGEITSLKLSGDRVDFEDREAAEQTPIDLFRIFRIAARKPAAEIHPEALKAVAAGARFIKRADLRDPAIATLFRAILLDTEKPENVLRDMSEVGLLGTYMPAFGNLVGRVKYGLYRAFTLDEHVLRSVGILDAIRRGEAKKEHPVATRILSQSADPAIFYIAILLHETAETMVQPDASKLRSRINASIGSLIEDRGVRDNVIWAAMRYRMMATMALRRNVMEPRTIRAFAEEVGDVERLDLLMVVTVCHLRMAGIDSWDSWTRRNLTLLYEATGAWFEGGEEALARHLARHRETLRNRTARLLGDWPLSQLERSLDRLPSAFFEGVTPETASRFVKLMKAVDGASVPGMARLTMLDEGMVEAAVYSRDRPGLYAAMAGVVVAAGGVVRASTAFPVRAAGKGADMAGNILVFQGEQGMDLLAGEEDGALAALEERFNAALGRPGYEKISLQRRVGDRRGVFDVESQVVLDQETSADCLIVEAKGLDRPGLLHRLAAELSDIGVSIRSAYVATYGETAVDTFYVQDLPGYKIVETRRQEVIRRRLLSVLDKK